MRRLLLALLLCLLPHLAHAECGAVRDFIAKETTGEDKFADTFYFRREHRADSVLLLIKHSVDRGHLPSRWIFLHKDDPKAQDYCIVSRGVVFGQHQNMPENASADNFGPEGSGFPRCTKGNAEFSAPELLRNWANRELGDSSILYTASPNGPAFQFLIAEDQDWIIIQDDADKSCLFDRGTDIMLRFNITLQN